MSKETSKYLKFGGATALILMSLAYLAYTGVQESKSYYVTIKELRGMGDSAYSKRLRVAGNVEPGSIRRTGTRVEFVLIEQDQSLRVVYNGTEAPPDTFKTILKRSPKAASAVTAFSRPNNYRQNALPSMLRNSPARRRWEPLRRNHEKA